MLIVQQVDYSTGPLSAGNDFRARSEQTQQTQCGRLLHHIHCIAGYQKLGNFIRKRFGHVPAADVGDTLQRQVHVYGIARLQIIFDALDDEFDQIAICVHQHRYEEVALNGSS